MVEIRRILCPIDFSQTSRHALDHAVAIAKWYRSEITLLNVMPLEPQPPIRLAGTGESDVSFIPDRRSMEEELRAWSEPARREGIKADIRVDQGAAASQIVEHARRANTDLLVIGTHGLSGFERFLLGSVTEKVLRKASCPVMTVPPASSTTAKIPYKRLLCPVDFSESSLAALRFACSIAKEANADLTLLHVCESPPDDERLLRRFEEPTFRQLAEENARDRLEALVTDDLRTWASPSTAIAHGKPYREILSLAEREATDLIVIGVRGPNVFDLTAFGSTTNQVVRHASCPVVTLKK
jgi:CPA2 family monovalent cation:H+ antiporter-2